MEPDWLVPSAKMWRARRWVVLATSALVVLILGLVLGLSVGVVAVLIAAAVVLVAAAAIGLLLWRRYRAWGYAEREDDLLVKRGVMIRRLTVVPYGRMQFVDVTAGPVDRLFGLATVQLHTAASATDAKIPGLDTAEANRLRDRLATLGEANAAGL